MNELTELENIALHGENEDLYNQLRYKEQVIQYLSNSLDREMKITGRIRSILREVNTGKMSEELAMSYIQMIVGAKR